MAKYKAYPEYKDSGIEWLGVIPKGWTISKVKYLAPFQVGWTPPTKNDANFIGDNLWVNISDLKDKFISSTAKCISDKAAKEASMDITPRGSLLYSFKLSVGAVSFAGCDLYTNEAIASFLDRAQLPLSYLYYALPIFIIENASTNIYGAKILNQELIKNSFLLAPLHSEAEKVANFLDHETAKIDNLIEKQQQLIELLKEKRQAVISHAVTKGLNPDVPMKDSGVEWLEEVPEHWKICRIKQLSKQISKGTTPSTIGGDFVDEGIRFLKAENIGKSKFVNSLPEFYITNDVDKQISRSRLQERDVLVIIAGATTGMASVLQKEILPANTNQAVSFIRTKNINHADWIYYWLGTDTIQRIIGMGAVQAAQPNLSMEDLGNIPILLPEQDELASICMEIEKQFVQFEYLICKAETAIDLMQERRTALISAAVTGKIDVRDWVAPDTQDVEEPQEATA
ncbi:restriction endonuclease subunit S [Lelliottia amnigena]|uniref:restriction endonuclease subunit S n=1 Tax=Lelliottia amnigena TaxID=61646 RepID=UPI00192B8006|nr:restriction endonuclease subunit S [Lelliottia amnigena]MBL5965653.1 restriction endonuclease subunit S [Lelliottia amnigena]